MLHTIWPLLVRPPKVGIPNPLGIRGGISVLVECEFNDL